MRCSVHAQAIHSKCELQEDPCVQPANIDVVIVVIAGILYLKSALRRLFIFNSNYIVGFVLFRRRMPSKVSQTLVKAKMMTVKLT